ncbi:glycosyl hydrolase family 18 protein [Nocardioides sp. URHA0020]|uniref:glycosyl hydrolase family 18 protein n=1 Tax=Nocardioides sp. URHA0020 TaxID=1380392 RepID=UPI00055D0C55|nr:glycosyl hydrolase family 18 protein [Nocardioides sp. URHA0020]
MNRVLGAVVGIALVVAPLPAAAREPAGLAVTGWALDDASSALVRRNAEGLSTLSVAGVSINASGTGVTRPSSGARRLARSAHRQGLTAELLVGNYSDRLGDFDARAAHRLLSRSGRITAVARRLASYVAAGHWDGVNIDLELVRASDADGLVRLARALQRAMPATRTVTIDISASTSLSGYRQGGYDLAGLAGAVDVIKLMTYDQHGPGWSGAGPVGGLPWQRAALRTILRVVPARQVDLGVAGYGYTWPRRGVGRTVTVAQARRLVARDHARATWHARQGEWSARLGDGTRLWWSDHRSYRHRVALARRHHLHGLAVWRLGSADTLR